MEFIKAAMAGLFEAPQPAITASDKIISWVFSIGAMMAFIYAAQTMVIQHFWDGGLFAAGLGLLLFRMGAQSKPVWNAIYVGVSSTACFCMLSCLTCEYLTSDLNWVIVWAAISIVITLHRYHQIRKFDLSGFWAQVCIGFLAAAIITLPTIYHLLLKSTK